MTETTPVEQISFLARSETRIRILERLQESGSTTQRELRDQLEVSRSTVTRSLSALEERGWIEQTSRSYRLTPTGDIVARGFLDLMESIEISDELSTFLDWFPYAEHDLDLSELSDSEITSSSDPDPYAPARRQTELLHDVNDFRGFLPSIDLEGTRVVHEQVTEGRLEAEVVVSPSVEATIETGEFAALFREKVETGRLTVLVSDEKLPFYLGIGDTGTVQIGVEDDEGFPRALLETTTTSVQEWAEDVYREYRERAHVKPASEF